MSGFITPSTPNLTDFLTFLGNTVQIPVQALPAGSPWPGYALDQAIGIVLNPPTSPTVVAYSLACYNCATHLLIAITPDQPAQSYFTTARGPTGFGIIQPSTGLVVAAGDQGTTGNTQPPTWLSGLTIEDLDFMKTPWGRRFLMWQQAYGPTVWGLS